MYDPIERYQIVRPLTLQLRSLRSGLAALHGSRLLSLLLRWSSRTLLALLLLSAAYLVGFYRGEWMGSVQVAEAVTDQVMYPNVGAPTSPEVVAWERASRTLWEAVRSEWYAQR